MVRILNYFYFSRALQIIEMATRYDRPFTNKEVCKEIDIAYEGTYSNIKYLVECGFLEKVSDKFVKKYMITNKGREIGLHLIELFTLMPQRVKYKRQLEKNKGDLDGRK